MEGKQLSGAMDAGELAELVSAFNELTGRLEATHQTLRDEVARLKRELGEANAELERSRRLAALGEMAAGIAHEVRNPLGSIGLFAAMLKQDLADRPEQQATAVRIVEAVRDLDAIVNDVLLFSREIRLRTALVPAGGLFEDALLRVADLLSAADSPRLIRGPGLCADVELEADRGLMTQALVNVVRNAIEATLEQNPSGGGVIALDVRTSAETAGSGRSGPMVVFQVRDTGPGVSDEVLDRMFNPFFTTRAAGTGLGLPIVHRIVEAHGGRVVVFNNTDAGGEPGGATFELHIPSRIRTAAGSMSSGSAGRTSQCVMERAG